MQMTSKSILATAPVYPDVPARDIGRARQFYGETLGLEISEVPGGQEAGMFMAHGGKGTQFLVYRTDATDQATVATWLVDDIQSAHDDLASRGIKFEHYDLPMTTWQGDIATMGPQGSSGKGAWFKDSEGNILNLAEM